MRRAQLLRTVALSCGIALPVWAEPPASPPEGGKVAESKPVSASNEAKACFRNAQAAYVAGNLTAALEGFQCAYQAAPSPELHFNLARVYERMGEAEQGIQHYRAYLEASQPTPREKKQIEARVRALEALRERQRAAIEAAKPTAEDLSAEARVFYDRGVKLYRAQQYKAALAAFSAALQMSSAPELHYNLAVVSERLKKNGDAIDHYRAYLAARPDADDRQVVEQRIAELQSER